MVLLDTCFSCFCLCSTISGNSEMTKVTFFFLSFFFHFVFLLITYNWCLLSPLSLSLAVTLIHLNAWCFACSWFLQQLLHQQLLKRSPVQTKWQEKLQWWSIFMLLLSLSLSIYTCMDISFSAVPRDEATLIGIASTQLDRPALKGISQRDTQLRQSLEAMCLWPRTKWCIVSDRAMDCTVEHNASKSWKIIHLMS